MINARTVITDKAALLATAILLGQGLIYYTGSGKQVIPSIRPWKEFPATVDKWSSVGDAPIDQDSLDKLKPDDYLSRNYLANGDAALVNFFVGYFNSRRDGRAPHSPEWCLPGAGWKSLTTKRIQIPYGGSPSGFTANEYVIQKGLEEELVLYWYHQGTRSVAGELMAQLYSLPDLIFHGRTDTALIRIIVPVRSGDMPQATQTAIRFAQEVYPLVRKQIL
jgi:EpsI family protein